MMAGGHFPGKGLRRLNPGRNGNCRGTSNFQQAELNRELPPGFGAYAERMLLNRSGSRHNLQLLMFDDFSQEICLAIPAQTG